MATQDQLLALTLAAITLLLTLWLHREQLLGDYLVVIRQARANATHFALLSLSAILLAFVVAILATALCKEGLAFLYPVSRLFWFVGYGIAAFTLGVFVHLLQVSRW